MIGFSMQCLGARLCLGLSFFLMLMISLQAKPEIRWTEEALRLDYLGLSGVLDERIMNAHAALLTESLDLDSLPEVVITSQPEMLYDPEARQILLPFSVFYRSYDGLRVRFPEQKMMRDEIFLATSNFLVLSKVLESLVSELELEITGWADERIDSLALTILLHTEAIDTAFLLDAAEEFLILDRSRAAFQGDRFKNEFEEDEYRLRQILCMISGYEAQELLNDPAVITLDRLEYKNCQDQYASNRKYWKRVLVEYLKPGSKLDELLTAE